MTGSSRSSSRRAVRRSTARLRVSAEDALVIALDVARLAAETFPVKRARLSAGETISVDLSPRDHPRDALRAFMEQLGRSWLVEDDGWYANVAWVGERFPVAGVDNAELFLRPWRDPHSGDRLQGEPNE